jgi:D-alanine--poly(phosphoribitol) ligase subunit 2
MSANGLLQDRLHALFRDKLNLEVPSVETDLLNTGLLDSLLIVDLLLHIEREFGRTLPMEEFELEDFRTLATIARCVERKGKVTPQGSPPLQPGPAGATD